MLDVSVIIVNYRTERHAARAVGNLISLEDECPAEILLVDNNLWSGLRDHHFLTHPSVKYLPLETNYGFAGGIAHGMAHATHDIVFILHPDAEPEPGCLAGLAEALTGDNAPAAAVPALLPFEYYAEREASAWRRAPGLILALAEHSFLGAILGRERMRLANRLDASDKSEPVDCATAPLVCMGLRHEWIDRTGGIDQDFFLFWEGEDFCRRLRRAGGALRFFPQLHCRHLGGVSQPEGEHRTELYWKSLHRYFRKHATALGDLMLRAMLAGAIGLDLTASTLLSLIKQGRDRQLNARCRDLWLRLRAQF